MKNIFKDRFNKCERVLAKKWASKEHEMWSTLVEALCAFGMRPHREDAETEVEYLGSGQYKIIQEAPTTGFWSQGYRCETIVQIYTRGTDTYFKMLESKLFRPGETPEKDSLVISMCARGNKVTSPHSIESKTIQWLRLKIEQ